VFCHTNLACLLPLAVCFASTKQLVCVNISLMYNDFPFGSDSELDVAWNVLHSLLPSVLRPIVSNKPMIMWVVVSDYVLSDLFSY
jgi:hypothetical protein